MWTVPKRADRLWPPALRWPACPAELCARRSTAPTPHSTAHPAARSPLSGAPRSATEPALKWTDLGPMWIDPGPMWTDPAPMSVHTCPYAHACAHMPVHTCLHACPKHIHVCMPPHTSAHLRARRACRVGAVVGSRRSKQRLVLGMKERTVSVELTEILRPKSLELRAERRPLLGLDRCGLALGRCGRLLRRACQAVPQRPRHVARSAHPEPDGLASLGTRGHIGARPVHIGTGPVHISTGPIHTDTEPVYISTGPIYIGAGPLHICVRLVHIGGLRWVQPFPYIGIPPGHAHKYGHA